MADIFQKPQTAGNMFNNSNLPPIGGGLPPKVNKNQIITNLYKTVLGRDPDPNALMYYISQTEIDENVIRKQMVESEEHKKILEEYKKITALKKEIENLKKNIELTEKRVDDKQKEIKELDTILSHKSQEISRIREESQQHTAPATSIPQPPLEIFSSENGIAKFFRKMLKMLHLVD